MLSMLCDIQWSTLWTLNNIEWWSTLYKYVQWSRLYNFEFPQHPLVNPGTNTLVNAVQYSLGNTMVNEAGALPRNNRKERGETHCPHSRSRIHSKTMETLQCNAREALKLLMGHLLEFLAWVNNSDFPKLIATRPYHIRFDHLNILFLFDIVFKSYIIS